MKNRILYFVLGLVCIIACDPVDETPPTFETKNKTVLVYIAGNNNLTNYAKDNLGGILNGYVPKNDNLLVYYHIAQQKPVLLKIYQNGKGAIVADTIYKFSQRNSATIEALVSTMKVVKTMYPAKEYGAFLWSHGTGWLPTEYFVKGEFPNEKNTEKAKASQLNKNYTSISNVKEIWNTSTPWEEYPNGIDPAAHLVKSFGSETDMSNPNRNKEIEITDLAKMLPYKLSFLVFDACFMGTIEVLYELKDSVDYIISSPTEILANGFPYKNIMQHVFKTSSDLKAVAEEYFNYYNQSENPYATISLVKTSELEKVAEEAKKIFEKHRDTLGKVNVLDIQRYFRYNKHWFYDIGDYITKLSSVEEAKPFIDALNKAIIYKAATKDFLPSAGGFSIEQSKYNGLSTYIPSEPSDSKLDNFYKNFKWNQATNFIQ